MRWSRGNGLARSALLGAASGSRTFSGGAALTVASRDADPDLLAVPAQNSRVKAAAVAVAGAEFVLDKLPQAPSRLAFPGLAARLLAGGFDGMVVAKRWPPPADPQRHLAMCMATGVAAAGAGAWVGHRWRGWAAPTPRVGRPRRAHALLAAVAEDVVVVGLAAAGARP